MVGVGSGQRDLEGVRAGLERWFDHRQPERGGVRVGPLHQPSAGFSSQTLLVDLAWDDAAGEVDRVVVRLPPAGAGLFPSYDLDAQFTVQQAMSSAGVPVARPIASEPDEGWLSAPFLVMEHVAGEIPGEQPPYWVSGWLVDAGSDMQRRAHDGFLDALAAVHLADWRSLGLGALARGEGDPLTDEIGWWSAYLNWAAGGSPAPDLVDALAWCKSNVPRTASIPSSLLWGDVRLGNVVFSPAGDPLAVLDWEMASIGPAEVDLAWYMALRRLPGGRAELPGFPDRAQTLAAYEVRVGRPLLDLRWFEAFALLRSEAILDRIKALLGPDLGEWLDAPTPMRRRLAKVVAGG